MVWLADYEAWGNTSKVIYSGARLEELKVSKAHLQPIRFQGQHCDTETGLHYNRFRYYDPDMGMFTSRDPIGLQGGDNVFAYAPNPTGWVDPLGLASTAASLGSDLEKANNARRAENGTSGGGVARNVLRGASVVAAADLAVPEPTDLFWPKLALEAGIVGLAATLEVSQSKTDDKPCTSGD